MLKEKELMLTIKIDVPDTVLEHYSSAEEIRREVYENFVIDQFKKANISISQGAEMLGLTYSEFMVFLGKRQVSWIQATAEEREESYQNLKQVS